MCAIVKHISILELFTLIHSKIHEMVLGPMLVISILKLHPNANFRFSKTNLAAPPTIFEKLSLYLLLVFMFSTIFHVDRK